MPEVPDSLIEIIARRLRAGQRVRRRIGEHGWLHIDRPVPFLCVHRLPEDRPDKGTRRLVMGEGSYLLADGNGEAAASLERLMHGVVGALSDEFKAVLLIEVSSNPDAAEAIVGGALVARPCFRVVISSDAGRATVAAFVRALRRIRILRRKTRVKIVRRSTSAPVGLPALLDPGAAKQWSVLSLGLEVPPIHQDPVTGEVFPGMLRQMHRHVSRALKQVCFRFAHLETPHRPEHYLTLGQRALLRSVREADEQLAAVDDSFNLLLAVTPVNTRDALTEFAAGGYRRAPAFHYRLLEFDPDVLKRRLYGISLELIEDPALGELLRDKREELDRQITLLHDRNTERFLYGSLQLYGEVGDKLASLAEAILARPHQSVSDAADEVDDGRVGAAAFALRATEEIDRYREVWPELSAGVEVRDDVPGLLVSRGRLLVSEDLHVPPDRVEPLIQHEIGTHVLTYHNALAQPLRLLATGLPGYDELQEGTAVLAEYLVGGLQLSRLRLLAARVLAVRRLVERCSFAEVFSELHEGHGFGRGTSFTTTMRVFRGGGSTKDAVYLRGLARLLAYLGDGGDVEPLFLGKVSHASLPIVRELRWREVLRPAPLRPRFLDLPGAVERLQRLRGGATVNDLTQEG